MKSYLFTLLVSITSLTAGWTATDYMSPQAPKPVEEVKLISNMSNEKSLPPAFRTSTSAFKFHLSSSPSRKGMSKLMASGSSQFSEEALKVIIRTVPLKNIYIIDLRQESHGFFDGRAVSWHGNKNWNNAGKSYQAIEEDESSRLVNVANVHSERIFDSKTSNKPFSIFVSRAYSERELAQNNNVHYLRFYVQDHCKPTDDMVDSFVQFIKTLPKDAWLHFHCKAGKGRTTTFMVMYDMMVNAKDVAFEDILERQWLLGGINLSSLQKKHNGWKQPLAIERYRFLKKFYAYCIQNPTFTPSFSEWLSRNP